MKRTILLIAALFTFAAGAHSQTVNEETARLVATNFWNSYRSTDVKPATVLSTLSFSEIEHMHIFDINGEGFVIVSGDLRVQPILAYSFNSTFPEELNPELGYWLRGYEAQLSRWNTETPGVDAESNKQWQPLLTAAAPDEPVSTTLAVPALMTTRWNQSPYYNKFCPYDSVHGGHAVVGCVATAMAQIMRYWQYPAYGQGSHTYHYRYYGDISADFENTSYLWHIMPNICNEYSQEAEVDATATISFHCGVAVEMMYGTSAEGGSGAYSECGPWTSHCAVSAFVDYFKYDSSIQFAHRYGISDEAWTAILDNEVENGRPVYYHGSDSTGGHAFVLDGADTAGHYHFNWGWGGFGDGFYSINDLGPRDGGGLIGGNATYTFNLNQGIIYNIHPAYTEVFDTVDYLDSICDGTQYVQFRDYNLLVYNVKDRDTLLHHLDTVFRYHLKVIQKKKVYLNPNNGEMANMQPYCPATGFTFPPCTFTKANCMFTGWCRNRDGNDIIYQPGEMAWFNNNPTFYALWIDTTASVDIEAPEKERLSVWPTLASEYVNISVDDADAFTITVIDNWGRVVIQKESVGGKAKISLERLPAGTYTVQILTKGTLYKSRIIKL